MSEDVSMKGKLVPVSLEGMTAEEKALSLIPKDKHVNVSEFYESALEYLTMEMNYYFHKPSGTLYELSIIEEDLYDFMELIPNGDGSYDFLTRFYNGGTYLGEMLNEGFANLPEDE